MPLQQLNARLLNIMAHTNSWITGLMCAKLWRYSNQNATPKTETFCYLLRQRMCHCKFKRKYHWWTALHKTKTYQKKSVTQQVLCWKKGKLKTRCSVSDYNIWHWCSTTSWPQEHWCIAWLYNFTSKCMMYDLKVSVWLAVSGCKNMTYVLLTALLIMNSTLN
jgi:hypothetical protein